MTLAVLTARLRLVTRRSASRLRDVIRTAQPETVLKWYRELVRRKWLQKGKRKGGRPRISQELDDLIVQMAQENSRWGYGKIEGDLRKLGIEVSESHVRDVLKRHNITPAPVRSSSSWRHWVALSTTTIAPQAIRLLICTEPVAVSHAAASILKTPR
ncbi:MAG: hypothetical protein DRJ03_31120 [Chloroflexi bacterium]|nr:MAG: hypothetical protein DRJ03_31120 [Chloroflexota bacterium]